jgi:hypothetical protein
MDSQFPKERLSLSPFTTVKVQNQPRRPARHAGVKKMWYTYTMEYSAIKNDEVLSFAAK